LGRTAMSEATSSGMRDLGGWSEFQRLAQIPD
jgi:hypothetical protein